MHQIQACLCPKSNVDAQTGDMRCLLFMERASADEEHGLRLYAIAAIAGKLCP
jgi:hypothetical protein